MSTPMNRADLAEVQATDALLDRLGLGTTTATDREDSLVEALVALRTDLEQPGGDPGVDIARLLEVLGERPLYLVDGEDDEAAELPIHLGRGAETDRRLVVDLTELAAAAPDGLPEPQVEELPTGVAAFTARASKVAAQLREKTPGHALLPAASVVALLTLALSSGVSGVVTGDPMAPVSGVGRVLSALPGVSSDRSSVQAFNDSLQQASELAAKQKAQAASSALADAKDKVDELPAEQQDEANAKIAAVQAALDGANPAAVPSATPAPSGQPSATPAASPSLTPTPSDSASPTDTPSSTPTESTDAAGSGSTSVTAP